MSLVTRVHRPRASGARSIVSTTLATTGASKSVRRANTYTTTITTTTPSASYHTLSPSHSSLLYSRSTPSSLIPCNPLPRALQSAAATPSRSGIANQARTFASAAAINVPAGSSPLTLYEANITNGILRDDPRQRQTVMLLEATFQQLLAARTNGGKKRINAAAATPVSPASSSSNGSGGGGFFGFAKKLMAQAPAAKSSFSSNSDSSSSSPFFGIRGLYMHGGVGSGKTMLMNQFFDCLPPISTKTVRMHFHSFMLDIHRRLHSFRKAHPNHSDPISHIARELVQQECEILALDEFQVTDVADAMILKQLFNTMWMEGCVLVATSNRPPEDLYKNGLNRSVFLPFIDDLKSHCLIHALEEGQDHRLLGTIAEGVYFTPLSPSSSKAIQKTFDRLAGEDKTRRGETRIPVMMGREMKVPLAAMNGNVALFTFSQLCETNVGAADYIALVQQYKYICVTDIPILYFHQREKIRRFITFLDVAYEHYTRLILQASEVPLKLFQAPTMEMTAGIPMASPADGATPEFEGIAALQTGTKMNGATPVAASTAVGVTSAATTTGAKYDEQFASSRAISRLIEMSSKEYLEACAKMRDQPGAQEHQVGEGSRSRQHLEIERAQKHHAAL